MQAHTPDLDLTDAFTDLYITGPDARTFLQGQLTCDVYALTTTQGSLGAHCNLKGRVVSLFHLYPTETGYRLTLPSALLAIAQRALAHYARFAHVHLAVKHPKRTGLIGPSAMDTLTALNLPIPEKPYAVCATETHQVIRHWGAPRFEILGEWPTHRSCQPDITDWHAAQIESKEPYLTPETSACFLPHTLDLPALGAVSFKKGCYLGQEIIARMEYRGQHKKHLTLQHYPMHIAHTLSPGNASPDQSGTVVCVAHNSALVIQ